MNPKWIKDLNIKAKTIKLLEENIRQNLHDIGFGDDFSAYDTKSIGNMRKIDKLDFIKLKILCTEGHYQ